MSCSLPSLDLMAAYVVKEYWKSDLAKMFCDILWFIRSLRKFEKEHIYVAFLYYLVNQ